MDKVTLQNTTPDNKPLKAVYVPELGMNMISYQLDDIEVIDQSTFSLFKERFAGLGALIGPHFHRQKDELIPKDIDDSLFPHIAAVKAKGVKDPFSHGIGRYVAWNYTYTHSTLKATLSSEDSHRGVPLKNLEGCDFSMCYEASLTPTGLEVSLEVEASRPSIMGLHYYYRLNGDNPYVSAHTGPEYSYQGEWMPIPRQWKKENHLHFTLDKAADYGFIPPPPEKNFCIDLFTQEYQLQIIYTGTNTNHSCQLFHPDGASYACLEPLSAHNPRKLTENKSSLKAKITIS